MHNATMSEHRNNKPPPSRMARVNEKLARLLEKLAERNATTWGIELNRAARLLLEQEGLWPPPPK